MNAYNYTIYYLTKFPKTYTGENTASLTSGAGKTACPHAQHPGQMV